MTYRQVLREFADERYGLVTTQDAIELGVPAVELRKLAARGALTHLARGLYRMPDIRPSQYDQFAEAVQRVGDGAYLTGDAVLALHNLALVNPRRIRVGTATRIRHELPPYVEIIRRQIPKEDLTEYEGIRSTTVAQALLDCRGLVMRERLLEALREATKKGLVTRSEAASTRAALRNDKVSP